MSRGRVSFEENETTPQQGEQSVESRTSRNGYFSADDREGGLSTSPLRDRRRASLSIRIPPNQATTDMGFTALQYLPMPVLVLSSAKTIVLANEAMARLLGIDVFHDDENLGADEEMEDPTGTPEPKTASEILGGVTLTELGLDLLQGGNPVFVSWAEFLETLVDDASRAQNATTQLNTFHNRGLDKDTTSRPGSHKRSASQASSRVSLVSGTRTEVHDVSETDGWNGSLGLRHLPRCCAFRLDHVYPLIY